MDEATATYLAGMGQRLEGLLTEDARGRLARMVVCGAGCGGVAGWTYDALCRLGCGTFRVADPETYEPSNANRQLGCDSTTVGKNKAAVTAERLRRLNPAATVEVFEDGVTEGNMERFLAGGTVVLDGIDLARLPIKKALFDAARARGLPVLSSPILGFGTGLAWFDPVRSPTFEAFFGPLPPEGDAAARRRYVEGLAAAFFSFRPRLDWPLFRRRVHAGQVPSVGVATMLSGALAATAVVDRLCGSGRFPAVPVTLHVDLMEGRVARTGPARRAVFRLAMRLFVRALARGDAGRS